MHKNKLFPIVFLLAVFLSVSVTYAAQEVTLDIAANSYSTYPGTPLKYVATIQNNHTTALNMSFFIEGADKTSWITISDYNNYIGRNNDSEVEFYITPLYGAVPDNYPFEIQITTDLGVITEKIIVTVLKREDLNFTTLKSEKDSYEPGELVKIITGVKNIGTLDSGNIYVDVMILDKYANKTATINLGKIDIKRENTGAKEFSFDKYTAKGTYSVIATAYDNYDEIIGQKTTTFKIAEKEIFNTKETGDSNIFYKTVVIEGVNTGNTEGTLSIRKSLFGFDWLYVFQTEPKISFANGDKEYVWECKLSPNETCTIQYKENYWMYYLLILLVIAIMSVAIYELERPHIQKKTYKKGVNYSVHIEMKNRSKKELKNVIVKDFIPTVLTFVESKDTIKPTSRRKHKNGTEFIWKLGKLNPGEERIISYSLKPMLDVVGGISLPEAEITAIDKNGKKYSGISAKLSVD